MSDSIKVDDRDFLEHLVGAAHTAADAYRQVVKAFLFSQLGGNKTATPGEGDASEII